MTKNLPVLQHSEVVCLDSSRLDSLYRHLGATQADAVLCAGMETLVRTLARIERDRRAGKMALLGVIAAELEMTAGRIGLPLLSRIAKNLQDTVDCKDSVAIAAVCARLCRVGNQSLSAFWNSDGQAG